jgi:hypothetical protein
LFVLYSQEPATHMIHHTAHQYEFDPVTRMDTIYILQHQLSDLIRQFTPGCMRTAEHFTREDV